MDGENLELDKISTEEAIHFLNLEEEEGTFEENYIPSRDVRAKIAAENRRFSDRDKAAIIWNSTKPLSVKHADLIAILQKTGDETLKEQIAERIRYDAMVFRLFEENVKGFVFATNMTKYPEEDCIIGYFASKELAYNAGKKAGYSFQIEKYQIIEETTVKLKHWAVVSPLLVKDVNKQIEEIDSPGSPVATMEYDEKGKLIRFWSCEVSKEDMRRVESLGRYRFENAYVVFPNPFELGDYVRAIGSNKIGRVDVSAEDWEKYVEKALAEDAIEDYSDASLEIQFDYDGVHKHLSPIVLEKVAVDSEHIVGAG